MSMDRFADENGLARPPSLRAVDAAGRIVDEPSDEELHDLLADLDLRHRFVIVERLGLDSDQHYAQVYVHDDLSYDIEYRDGGPDRHYRAHVPPPGEMAGPAVVAEVLSGWAHGRRGWRDTLSWERLRW